MSRGLLYILVLSIIACCIEVDISVPSLPDISDYFDISDGLTQMTIAVNFYGFCISAALYGPLSENFGRRKMMIFGNAIMCVGAFLCTISDSIEFLLFARFIQGLGASASAVIVFAMVADLCSGREAAEVNGKMNSMITIIMSVAPIMGGFINQTVGWRGNYGFVFLVTIVAWLVIFFKLPETKKELEPFNGRKIASDYKRLFASRDFMLASLVPSMMFAGYMSFIVCGSFLYMESYGLPIMLYALHQGAIIASFSIISQKAGVINAYLGERKSIFCGVAMLMIGGVILFGSSALGIDNEYFATIGMIIGATGAAYSYPVIFAKSFDIFPDIRGSASSAIMSVRMLVTGLFVAVVSMLYDGSLFNVALVVLVGNLTCTLLTVYLFKIMKFEDNAAAKQ